MNESTLSQTDRYSASADASRPGSPLLVGLCTICALLLVAVAPVAADDQATRIMQAAIMSKGDVSYAADRVVEVWRDGRRVRTVRQRIHCKQGDKQRIETIEPRTEAGTLFVSNGRRTWEYDPDKQQVVVRQMHTPQNLKRHRERAAQLVAAQLSLQYGGRKTVASRSAHEIIIRDSIGRLLRKCWIDAHTNVELKMEKYGDRAALTTRNEIVTIDYSPRFISGMFDFSPPSDAVVRTAPAPAKRMTLAEAQRPAGFAGVVPGYLPPSYVFEQDTVAVTNYQGKIVLWLTFTNGLDTFSLFESPCTHGSPKPPTQHDCAVRWSNGTICFTLVGDLMSSDVENIIRSLQH